MVQGNLLAISITHWLIAIETGLIAGTLASAAILSAKLRKQWLISLTLGLITATTDYFVHPGMLGTSAFTEAIVTGVGAAVLSYAFSHFISAIRRKKST